MARFEVVVRTRRSPAQAWERLVDPARHTRAVPLTTVTGSLDAQGARLLARTRLGPLVLDDPMIVRTATLDDGGGQLVVEKQGRVVTGRIDARMCLEQTGTAVRWSQEIGIPWLPGALDPLVGAVARLDYGAALRRIVG